MRGKRDFGPIFKDRRQRILMYRGFLYSKSGRLMEGVGNGVYRY